MALVALALAKKHLRVDEEDDEDLITLYLAAAEAAAQAFLNRAVFPDAEAMQQAIDANTAGDQPMVVSPDVQAAILLTLGALYGNREDVVIGLTVAELPRGATALLQPYRVGMGV
ncbi:MAG: head-tail connector protein [Rhodocyclaceae bacterium]